MQLHTQFTTGVVVMSLAPQGLPIFAANGDASIQGRWFVADDGDGNDGGFAGAAVVRDLSVLPALDGDAPVRAMPSCACAAPAASRPFDNVDWAASHAQFAAEMESKITY